MLRVCSTLIFLIVNTYLDIQKREISLVTAGVFGTAGIIWSIQSGRSVSEVILSMGTGILFLALSLLTCGAIGLGDAGMLLALGTMQEAERVLITLSIGMLLAGIWSLILLVVLKKNRRTEIPFVPFLLAGYIGGCILW